MKNNPFSSDIFKGVWLKIFNEDKPHFNFPFFDEILFVKNNFLGVYCNVGRTNTKGISYSTGRISPEIKKKCFLIFDVPEYFKIEPTQETTCLKLIKIKQYQGFLINTENQESIEKYLSSNFSKSSRYKLKKYKKKFEKCFKVDYKMFRGPMERQEYDILFDYFRELLEKRFDEKQITNNNLYPKEWEFYQEVTYPMILEKKAGLFVIYDSGKPVGVTLNYFSNDILFDAITVFDIEYSKFHLGSITIMKLIEWCIQNNFKSMDFSKGYFDYKKRWATNNYNFEYHIYYDHKSVTSTIKATILSIYFKLKQTMREKHLNEKLHRLTYRLKNKKNVSKNDIRFQFLKNDDNKFERENFSSIHWESNESLKRQLIFEFLYLFEENKEYVKVFIHNSKENNYYIQGKSTGCFVIPLGNTQRSD